VFFVKKLPGQISLIITKHDWSATTSTTTIAILAIHFASWHLEFIAFASLLQQTTMCASMLKLQFSLMANVMMAFPYLDCDL